jgi:radical SAM protein with 4Fe4S-binding SPASM domain
MWSMPWNLKDELSPDEWILVADSLIEAGVKTMELYGGDVFLRKDALIPLLRHLRERDVTVHIPVNSLSLDSTTVRSLVDLRVNYLYFSTDGIAETHDKVRGVNGAFRKMKNAVAEIIEYRKDSAIPKLISLATISKYNVEYIDRLADFAAETGFDEIRFYCAGEMTPEDVAASSVDGLEPTPFFLRDGESILVSPAQARVMRKQLKAVRRNHLLSPIRINTTNIDCLPDDDVLNGHILRRKCHVERNLVTVDPGGNVVACPCFHSYKYGNIISERFEDVWFGDRHERFHRNWGRNGLVMCRRCIYSGYRNHSLWARLRMISLMRRRAAHRKLAIRINNFRRNHLTRFAGT